MIDQKWYKRFKAKNVLLRLDLNVPISDSQILDDSRVLSSIETVKRLYEAGAKEVHVRIACPEIKYPDFYGIDMPSKKELLAANKSLDQMKKFIGSDSLSFLSLNGLYEGLCSSKRNNVFKKKIK